MEISENNIYKFSPINEFLYRNLILSQLYFSPPDSMNDQLEGIVKFKNPDFSPSLNSIRNFIEINSLGDYYLNRIKKLDLQNNFLKFFVENWFRLEVNNNLVTCFSRIPNEPLMWAHYANKHSGLCLIYDKNILLEGLQDFDGTFQYCSIDYVNKPIVELFEINGTIEYSTNNPLISAKSLNWKYEDEIRLLLKKNPGIDYYGNAISIYRSALKGIIYGVNMEEEHIDSISKIIQNDPLYSNIQEYNANLDYINGGMFFTKD